MAKPLSERAAALLATDRCTITDLRAIIPEVREARERESATAEAAAAESVDLALSEADRDEAAAKSERSRRLALAYSEAADKLEAKLTAKLESESRKAKDAERAAALTERDQLAERFLAVVQPLCETLPALFAEVQANAERMSLAGLREPDAEALARGVSRTFNEGAGVVDRFTQMKVPKWGGKGRCWPPERRVDLSEHAHRGRLVAERARAELEAPWGDYELRNPGLGYAVHFKHRVSPLGQEERARTLYREPWTGQIRHTEAERLKELGVSVTPSVAPAVSEPA